MSHIFRFSRWPPFFLLGIAQQITAEISHLLIFGARTWCFCENMMSLSGIPCQNLGKHPENRDFSWFCLIMCMPITKQYLFCWKLHLNIDFTPLLPLTPPPLPNPSCSHPLAPFCNPFPQQFCPPMPKVNRQLKIVNYLTCMQHFFYRW